jgi:hypothetical protein
MVLLPVLTSLVSVSTPGPPCFVGSTCQTTASPTSFWIPTIAVWIISGVITILFSLMLKAAEAKRRLAIGLSLLATALAYFSGVGLFAAGYEISSVPSRDPVLFSLDVSALCLGPLLVLIDGILIIARPSVPEPSIAGAK